MRYLILVAFLLSSVLSIAQDDCAECSKFKITGVYDFGPPPGGNWIILLLTVSEDLDPGFDPHYADLYFVSTAGDTITIPYGPSLTLPQVVSDTIPYLLELNTTLSNQNFPIDFEGNLVIRNPTGGPCPPVTFCNIGYAVISTSIIDQRLSKKHAVIYPNPMSNEMHISSEESIRKVIIYNQKGALVKTVLDYKNEEIINLIGIENGMLLVQLIFDDQMTQVLPILKLE